MHEPEGVVSGLPSAARRKNLGSEVTTIYAYALNLDRLGLLHRLTGCERPPHETRAGT